MQAVVDVINSLPTTDDLANYTPTIELKPEDEGYQDAYQAALDAYYSQVQEKVKAARAAYDALTEEQKAAFDATVLAKLTALEELIAMREQADVLPEDAVTIIDSSISNETFNIGENQAIVVKGSADSITTISDSTFNLSGTTIYINGSGVGYTGETSTKMGIGDNVLFKNCAINVLSGQSANYSSGNHSAIGLFGKANFENCTITVSDWTGHGIGFYGDANVTFTESSLSSDGVKGAWSYAMYGSSVLTLDSSSMSATNMEPISGNINAFYSGDLKNNYDAIYIKNHSSVHFYENKGGGFAINSINIHVDDSEILVENNNGSASNSGYWYVNDSTLNMNNNFYHGLSAEALFANRSNIILDKNGYYGAQLRHGFIIDGDTSLQVTGNSYNFDCAGLKLTAGVTNGLVEAGATVNITDNYCSGLSNNGVCEFEEGVNLTITGNNNDKGTTSNGGGVYNSGASANLTLPSNAVIYNNHADTAGDDIFNNTTSTITFGKVGSDWTLEDCGDEITGWFDDSEGNRWEAHDAPLHVSEFTNFNDAGIATISGLTALKAAHPYLTPEIEPGDPDVPSSDWPISKSKTAENLDENFESKVTLSLPADSYKPSVDVVMVMDVSSSMKGEDITEAKAAATAMCDELASKTNANVNIGIVTFDKEARNLTNGLVSIEEAKNAINNIKASEDTNMMAGLIAGKAMLDAGTATDKYLVIMSDGIPIYWVENGETISKTLIRYKQDKVTEIDRLPAGSEPEGSAPEDFDSMLSIKQLLNITDWDTDSNEWKQVSDTGENINPDCKYTNIQKATYKTAQYMIDNIFGQYKIKMVAFGTDKYENNVVYKYGENLCDWIGDQDGVSYYKVSKPNYGGEAGDLVEAFTDIANEMIYLVDAGSQVVDEIGFGTYEDGTEYDFDFVNEISKLELTVGGKALDKVQIDDYTYGFGPDSTLPKDYQFIVTYYPNGLTRSVAGELFVWDIYVPITIDDKVQLTYSVKLNDPRTDDGEYGIYDPDGSANRNGLYTNNAAVLYPVDSNGNNGEPEAFDKPTVSYTVDNGNDNPGTDPTPDPDPDPDRPSRPNRDDDDDWEPLPDAPVKDKPTTEVDVPEETETPTTEQPDKYNPETGDTTTVFAAMALAAVSLGGVVLLGRKKK